MDSLINWKIIFIVFVTFAQILTFNFKAGVHQSDQSDLLQKYRLLP